MSDAVTIVAGIAIAVIAYLIGQLVGGSRRSRLEGRVRQVLDESAMVIGLNRELFANAWVQQLLDRGQGGGGSESTRLKAERAEAHRMIRELLNTVDVARLMTTSETVAGVIRPRHATTAAAQSVMVAIATGWQRSFGTGPRDRAEPGPRFAATQNRRVHQLEAEVGRLLDPPGHGERLRDAIHRAVTAISTGLRTRLSGTRLDPLMEPVPADDIPAG